jgi:hypothetical protein
MKKQIPYLILCDYSESLCDLSADHHVWICNSQNNDQQIQKVWAKKSEYSQGFGVTSFVISRDILDTFYEFLGTVDEHHSGDGIEYEQWHTINVLGITEELVLKTKIEEALNSQVSISPVDKGIAITRQLRILKNQCDCLELLSLCRCYETLQLLQSQYPLR